MSVRTHWAEAPSLAVSVFAPGDEIPEAYEDDDGQRECLRLVIEDGGNCEAIVIDGTPGELLDLGQDIKARANEAFGRQFGRQRAGR